MVYFTRFLSVCRYGCLEEVLNVILQINTIVYLLINQSESYDILLNLNFLKFLNETD